MSSRFDSRSVSTFKKDIKFGTRMEKYWWERWLELSQRRDDLDIVNPRDNGCDNDGEFIPSGNTAGADYMADVRYKGVPWGNLPIEIKWVPTAGKFTLKQNDLRAYARENASILFIYNSVKCGTDLRKPKDYNFEAHIAKIEERMDQIRWGLMLPDKVGLLYDMAVLKGWFKPVSYMGGKMALILKDENFYEWFDRETFDAA